MRISFILTLCMLLCSTFLTGCAGKTVDVVQPKQFKILADHMGKELIAHNILDENGSYVAPAFSQAGDNYGQHLYKRLSPAFIFEDTAYGMNAPTFAGSISPSDRAKVGENGFVIKYLQRTVTVNMIALVDWDGDGTNDWLISCLVEPHNGARTRDYTIIIPNPKNEGPLQARVIGVYECFGLACTLYMRESAAPTPTGPEPNISDTVPGLKPVTLPPGSAVPADAKENQLQERNLD
ncbi:MAG: hypothetical protein RRY29_10055 [Desulfovibrionaceae bacterium]